jgi:polar amino acid transport system substrate-binding protein
MTPPRSGLALGLPAAVLFVCTGGAPQQAGHKGTEADRPADQRAKPLVVCAVPASMPRTGRAADGTPQGLDVAVARLVGKALGRPVEFHWCASAGCSWNCLPERRCDVVAGQPYGSGLRRGVAWSVPYAGAQFGLVVARDARGVRSLDDLRGKRVGLVSGTVALSEKDHAVVRFKTREEALEGFKTAALDAAFVDADFAAWYLHDRPALALRLVPGFVPRERWNMALAVRDGDAALLVEINRALAQLAASGDIRKVYDDHGVPFRPPYDGSGRQPAAASDTWRRVADRGELVVSMDPANLPYSSARDDRPGLDVELARDLARRLGVKLRIEWLDTRSESAVGELLQGDCDAVFGEAVDVNAVADDQELAGKVLYSRPYYGTGYVLVGRKDGPRARSLADLKGERSKRLGAEAGSVADYSLRQRGYLRRLYRNQLAALTDLNAGNIDFAYLWANVGWTLHTSPELRLEIAPGYVPEDHWNIAVAMRRGDHALKRHVDEALDGLVNDGTVARTLARYHVPRYDPFPEQAGDNQTGADAVIRHAVADRGREPQMGKVQTSKRTYSGLARVRSAGELVVGLDQNNLPFSTAHPEPAGLDYEVAGLLAGKLGVSLRVYWAYSAHDSYPSKLAAKQLCDVILGVIPDDRFGQRVLFSRPYYSARYELVVRSGENAPSEREAVAVEEGVAVRGLTGREVRSYPSTEAVLEAVATGRVKAGYVISTRGRWLADKRWRGKLTFLPAPGPVDSFPVSAAVRKSDRDLNDAIGRAWDELDRSGQLARVFARWGIPYQPAEARRPGDSP